MELEGITLKCPRSEIKEVTRGIRNLPKDTISFTRFSTPVFIADGVFSEEGKLERIRIRPAGGLFPDSANIEIPTGAKNAGYVRGLIFFDYRGLSYTISLKQ